MGESTADYVADLRRLSRNCKFGELADGMIRDQVVEKAIHPKVRERFLQDKELTLEKVLIQSEAYERSTLDSKEMQKTAQSTPDVTASALGDVHKATDSRGSVNMKCAKCGRAGHDSRSYYCPARRSSCRNCGQRGHWNVVCREKSARKCEETEAEVLSCGGANKCKIMLYCGR